MANGALKGMKEIAGYVGMSESTVLKWHYQEDLPIRKVAGGIWVSTKRAIDKWFEVRAEMEEKDKPKDRSGR